MSELTKPIDIMQSNTIVTVNMAVIIEYERLKTAYTQLEKDKDELMKKYTELLESTTKYKEEIENLKKELKHKDEEIETLQNRIKSLENTIEFHENTIKSHENTIESLKDNDQKQSQRIKILEDTVMKLQIKDSLANLIIAIQDLNRTDQLEKNPHFTHKYLRKLRGNRNGENHCILDTDTPEIKDYKKKLILDRINQKSDINTAFDKKYGTLRQELIHHLSTQQLNYQTIKQENIDNAEEWWED